MPAIAISFDSNNLQTANVVTKRIDHFDGPDKNMNPYALAHANKSKIPFINYPGKPIQISGWIKGSSIADLDDRIDAFKAYFNNEDSNLDIAYGSGTRRYICTAGVPQITREEGSLTVAEFSLIFTCTEPFGRNLVATVANNQTGLTARSAQFAANYAGSAKFQMPVITYTLNTVTGGAGGYIQFVNAANGQGILVTGFTFLAGDVITIDPAKRSVTLTRASVTTEIDFLGSFTEIPRGAQQINYSDGFTAANYNVNISYNPLWN